MTKSQLKMLYCNLGLDDCISKHLMQYAFEEALQQVGRNKSSCIKESVEAATDFYLEVFRNLYDCSAGKQPKEERKIFAWDKLVDPITRKPFKKMTTYLSVRFVILSKV